LSELASLIGLAGAGVGIGLVFRGLFKESGLIPQLLSYAILGMPYQVLIASRCCILKISNLFFNPPLFMHVNGKAPFYNKKGNY